MKGIWQRILNSAYTNFQFVFRCRLRWEGYVHKFYYSFVGSGNDFWILFLRIFWIVSIQKIRKNIESHAHAFLTLNISAVGSVACYILTF